MRCTQCQFANPSGMTFCVNCGTRLALLCPACGAENRPMFKFCGQCGTSLPATSRRSSRSGGARRQPPSAGTRRAAPRRYTPAHLAEKILGSRSAIEGERKQVTVLFVDVSGFTALSERLDPEDIHQIMDQAFASMLDEVHRYEGTVNQFL